ncbi:efflux RND transporter periplasmic adaptor subunit [Cytophagaceae bacterium DM2B3-1]|uniref:Efflux RND transporter periplasmic adaptor subunit n=1 Tax=Xanthocytophaga flava TaxID=3048013 RepID=A0ABT7CSA5_9BACT|nr:efflux RND transporter periplasmic adaptor subunit [Xanthocytophaga flavus]MDJ1496623.1 efflux RND transporter periplasmic adaptor subunit [Xanthocytophaga flavus]
MKSKILIWFVPVALILLFLFVGVLPRVRNRQELHASVQKEQNLVVQVNTTTATRSDSISSLTLPGQIQPLRETQLYARTQGYLKKRLVDIGSPVKRGQLLASLDAPELDQDIIRAQTDLRLAKTNLERVESVTLPGAVSKQDIDNRQALYDMNQANLRRIEVLKSLQEIRAPFNGIVTARTTEQGALITAGNSTPLFTVSQLDTLRVYTDVPQSYYKYIQLGQAVEVRVPELSGKTFKGKVVRTSEALRSQSRTLLTEVLIPNPGRELVSGLYGQVNFQLKQSLPPVVIPANALWMTSTGPQVMVVKADNTLHVQPVEIARDFGSTVEIGTGLQGGENLVINPSDNLREGQRVVSKIASVPANSTK